MGFWKLLLAVLLAEVLAGVFQFFLTTFLRPVVGSSEIIFKGSNNDDSN